MRPKLLILILTFIAIAVSAWSPWITANSAARLAQDQFNRAWYGVVDGCGAYGDDLVTHDFQKTPFGGSIVLDYQCGLVMPEEPPLHTTVYVSFLGVAFGYPKP